MAGEAATLSSLGAARAGAGLWRRALRLAGRKPLGAISLFLILGMFLVAIGADLLAPHTPYDTFRGSVLVGPNPEFPMGTDHVGRDTLSRIIYGSRVSLSVGTFSMLLSSLLGAILGVISGYFEGRADMFLQRLMDAMMAVPLLVVAMVIMAVLGPGLLNVTLSIGIGLIPRVNRVVRSSVLAEKYNVYVEAAQAIGCNTLRIMARHIFPNITAPLIVISTVNIAAAIVIEASLSFLGVGVPAPQPSWGLMLGKETQKFMLAQPWLAVWPGVAISLAVLGWNLLGDALRDLWDPRLRGI